MFLTPESPQTREHSRALHSQSTKSVWLHGTIGAESFQAPKGVCCRDWHMWLHVLHSSDELQLKGSAKQMAGQGHARGVQCTGRAAAMRWVPYNPPGNIPSLLPEEPVNTLLQSHTAESSLA